MFARMIGEEQTGMCQLHEEGDMSGKKSWMFVRRGLPLMGDANGSQDKREIVTPGNDHESMCCGSKNICSYIPENVSSIVAIIH